MTKYIFIYVKSNFEYFSDYKLVKIGCFCHQSIPRWSIKIFELTVMTQYGHLIGETKSVNMKREPVTKGRFPVKTDGSLYTVTDLCKEKQCRTLTMTVGHPSPVPRRFCRMLPIFSRVLFPTKSGSTVIVVPTLRDDIRLTCLIYRCTHIHSNTKSQERKSKSRSGNKHELKTNIYGT